MNMPLVWSAIGVAAVTGSVMYAVLVQLERDLRAFVDPVAVDRMAKDDQNALVQHHGGRELALGLGKRGATPVPEAPR